MVFYILSCATTSFFSMAYKAAHYNKSRGEVRSLGASGAIMAVLTFFALVNPHAKLCLFGLITAPAYVFVGGIVIYSVWQSAVPTPHASFIDVAGHVGGAFGGILYYIFGRKSSPSQFFNLLSDSYRLAKKRRRGRSRIYRDNAKNYCVLLDDGARRVTPKALVVASLISARSPPLELPLSNTCAQVLEPLEWRRSTRMSPISACSHWIHRAPATLQHYEKFRYASSYRAALAS